MFDNYKLVPFGQNALQNRMKNREIVHTHWHTKTETHTRNDYRMACMPESPHSHDQRLYSLQRYYFRSTCNLYAATSGQLPSIFATTHAWWATSTKTEEWPKLLYNKLFVYPAAWIWCSVIVFNLKRPTSFKQLWVKYFNNCINEKAYIKAPLGGFFFLMDTWVTFPEFSLHRKTFSIHY